MKSKQLIVIDNYQRTVPGTRITSEMDTCRSCMLIRASAVQKWSICGQYLIFDNGFSIVVLIEGYIASRHCGSRQRFCQHLQLLPNRSHSLQNRVVAGRQPSGARPPRLPRDSSVSSWTTLAINRGHLMTMVRRKRRSNFFFCFPPGLCVSTDGRYVVGCSQYLIA